jgi:hypothetical protein
MEVESKKSERYDKIVNIESCEDSHIPISRNGDVERRSRSRVRWKRGQIY